MKTLIHCTLLAITLMLFGTCETILLKPNPKTSNIAIFNEYATLVKEKYSMLDFKGVDIQRLQDSIGVTISDNLSTDELYKKLTIITTKLRDGHSFLFDPISTKFTSFKIEEGYPKGFDKKIHENNYIRSSNPSDLIVNLNPRTGDPHIAYGYLPQSSTIGYVWIKAWNKDVINDGIMKHLFEYLKNAKGLIVDVRQNGGGDPEMAARFASYLTDEKIHAGKERFKTGPGANDFSETKIYLEPHTSANNFTKPVAVLIDRFSYSATTTFVYLTDPLDHVLL